MTWQRLMAYAHQNIDIKPIPGLAIPFPEKPDSARTEKSDQVSKLEEEGKVRIRPAILNQSTRKMLEKLSEQFRNAPPLKTVSDRLNVSAIRN